jgi:hypothetical protein
MRTDTYAHHLILKLGYGNAGSNLWTFPMGSSREPSHWASGQIYLCPPVLSCPALSVALATARPHRVDGGTRSLLYLRTLKLHQNKLSGTLPKNMLDKTVNLIELDLSYNALTGEVSNMLSTMGKKSYDSFTKLNLEVRLICVFDQLYTVYAGSCGRRAHTAATGEFI